VAGNGNSSHLDAISGLKFQKPHVIWAYGECLRRMPGAHQENFLLEIVYGGQDYETL